MKVYIVFAEDGYEILGVFKNIEDAEQFKKECNEDDFIQDHEVIE